MPDWQTIKAFVETFGWTKGVFTIFFFLAHTYIFLLYRGRLKDRQREIDRLASDNHDYRDRFLALLDKHFGYEPNKDRETSTPRLIISAAERVDDLESEKPKMLETPVKSVFASKDREAATKGKKGEGQSRKR